MRTNRFLLSYVYFEPSGDYGFAAAEVQCEEEVEALSGEEVEVFLKKTMASAAYDGVTPLAVTPLRSVKKE